MSQVHGQNGPSVGPQSSNGQPSGQEAPASGRNAQGQFARGNPGGPGNPFARQVAALRKALVDAITAQDILEIVQKLLQKAKEGDPESRQQLKYIFELFQGNTQPVPATTVKPDKGDGKRPAPPPPSQDRNSPPPQK